MNGKLSQWIIDLLARMGIAAQWGDFLTRTIIGAAVVLLALASWYIAVQVVLRIIERVVKKTRNTWDDEAYRQGLFRRIVRIVPALVIWLLAPAFLNGLPQALKFVRGLASVWIIFALTMSLITLLNFANTLYTQRQDAKQRPIKGVIQAIQGILLVTAIILTFSVLSGKPVSGLLAGLGAVSAVLMLVFRDPLLGLVSGFQISSNDMVRIGDWLEAPDLGADGDVIDISLLNVTVRNWDKTYVTFPIQSLTTGSFKNWRGMSDSGGRRIKRSLSIDVSSIGFLAPQQLEKLQDVEILKPYLDSRTQEIAEYNRSKGHNRSKSPINGRALTNIGVFRAYAKAYISNHPGANKELTLMVRQLESGPNGLPIEVYMFSNNTSWVPYEELQADIFDHLIASLPVFELRMYQAPSGHDLRLMRKNNEPVPIDNRADRQQGRNPLENKS